MIEENPKNIEVLFPYINGEDLNTHPEQKESRWVINFWDWSLEHVQKEYPELLAIVEEKVKPERDRLSDTNSNGRRRKQFWWQYGEKCLGLYHTIGRGHAFEKHPKGWQKDKQPMERILALALTSKSLTFVLRENDAVFSHATGVFIFSRYSDFAIMQSSIHEAWSRKMASTLETRLRYTPSDCFDTFPFPVFLVDLESIGEAYHELRASITHSEWIGLTNLYNRFHSPDETNERIIELRELHRRMDEAVAAAYGWDDLELGYDFHAVGYLPENDRIRFTISEKTRIEVLRRLAILNRERYNEENPAGQSKKKGKTAKRAKTQSMMIIEEE